MKFKSRSLFAKSKETSTQTAVFVKKSKNRLKGRSNRTYQNKLRKATKFYNCLFKNSKIEKEKSKNTAEQYFCDTYPTLDKYLKINPIKKPNTRI